MIQLTDLSILVVGDLILDQYKICECTRLSPEAPVPIVNITHDFNRLGGAANVALNVSSLGVGVSLYSLVGNDSSAQSVTELLADENLKSSLFCADIVTTTKTRFVSQSQQLLRIDQEKYPETSILKKFFSSPQLNNLLLTHDLVLLSDYNKGALAFVEDIIDLCNDLSKPIVVDPKLSDLSRYTGATVLTPNFQEFQNYVGPCNSDSELLRHAFDLKAELGLKILVVTLGERGLLFVDDNTYKKIPTFARDVRDVTGAGDSFVSAFAVFYGLGVDPISAATLANIAAGISISMLGTASVTLDQIIHSHHAEEFIDLLQSI
jgi:rfaE bifunctional protein kinase chain/domain